MAQSSETQAGIGAGRVLVADDEPEPLRAIARVLRRAGFEVDTADHGSDAANAIEQREYDAVVSDISMPGIDGIELLRTLRRRDADVPVILVTGAPAVETAVEALEHGAYKYLVKPVSPERLEETVRMAVRLRQMARLRQEAVQVLAATQPSAELEESFASTMKSLWMAYQPIVGRDGTLYGYEALMRSAEPKLPHPGAVLDAAERLDRLTELGRHIHKRAAEPVEGGSFVLFVNLHPRDLEDEELVASDAPLARMAQNVVLEITERASVGDIKELRNKIARLRACGYRIAIDDLGAGYAGLTSFALLEPEIVKIDMTLVRDVDSQPVKQRLIRSITMLCREMGIQVVGEGVETSAERDTLVDLGCDLLQGYFLAKPGKPFPSFNW
jgi:EAL domain-containing protein (putative c-di-GMP-specific phosphodiesterase class I)